MKYIYEYLLEFNLISITFRMLFSVGAGTIIGLDRSRKGRAAGVKTHILVCMGATLVMLTSQFIYYRFDPTTDVGRMGAQVISGIGFLGVGTIIVTGNNKVKGLTTAAGLWTIACIGLAIGIGFYDGAIIACMIMIFVIKFLSRIEYQINSKAPIIDICVEFQKNSFISKFIEQVKKEGYKILNIEVIQPHVSQKKQPTMALISMQIGPLHTHEACVEQISQYEGIISVEEL